MTWQETHKVLLVEDDPALHANIKEALTAEGLHTESVFDGTLAEKLLQKHSYRCVILDINLPGKNGYELCRGLRSRGADTPVIMLTAFGDLDDKVSGFDAGADDYLTKPFYMRELLMRVRALVKRAENREARGPEQPVTVGDITVYPEKAKVMRQGKEVTLTPREYQILLKLLKNRGELVSKRELIKEIWGSAFDANTNTIEVYINFLRNKVDKPFGKASIKTKVGFGYYFDAE